MQIHNKLKKQLPQQHHSILYQGMQMASSSSGGPSSQHQSHAETPTLVMHFGDIFNTNIDVSRPRLPQEITDVLKNFATAYYADTNIYSYHLLEDKCSYVTIKSDNDDIMAFYNNFRLLMQANINYRPSKVDIRWYYLALKDRNLCVMCNSIHQETPQAHAFKCFRKSLESAITHSCIACQTKEANKSSYQHYYDSNHTTMCFLGINTDLASIGEIRDIRHYPKGSNIILPLSYLALADSIKHSHHAVGALNYIFYEHTTKDYTNGGAYYLQAAIESKSLPIVNNTMNFTCPQCAHYANNEFFFHYSYSFLIFEANAQRYNTTCGHSAISLKLPLKSAYYPLHLLLNDRVAVKPAVSRRTCFRTNLSQFDDDHDDQDRKDFFDKYLIRLTVIGASSNNNTRESVDIDMVKNLLEDISDAESHILVTTTCLEMGLIDVTFTVSDGKHQPLQDLTTAKIAQKTTENENEHNSETTKKSVRGKKKRKKIVIVYNKELPSEPIPTNSTTTLSDQRPIEESVADGPIIERAVSQTPTQSAPIQKDIYSRAYWESTIYANANPHGIDALGIVHHFRKYRKDKSVYRDDIPRYDDGNWQSFGNDLPEFLKNHQHKYFTVAEQLEQYVLGNLEIFAKHYCSIGKQYLKVPQPFMVPGTINHDDGSQSRCLIAY